MIEEFSGNGKSRTRTPVDRDEVERAFRFACERHGDQKRHSGDEFITHPVGVAMICAGLRLDTATLCAALLHDTVEDTSTSKEDIERHFGSEVATLVDGVTKLTEITFESRDERQAENYRKMMVAMASDIRVILIKLADRLHNMRTIAAMSKQKQIDKAKETLEIYAPIAHRLGIHAIKWELEDLAFQALHPRKYQEIKGLVAQQRDEREAYVREAGEYLARELEALGIEAEIAGRAKHFYSIYSKMTKKGREFNEIYDLTAMRVVVDSVKDCYGAVGVIHSLWKPLPGRFKDFIAMPKFNMYQSLHTTVIGPGGKPVELQIRTWGMHRRAEYGVAAHWKYKEETVGGRKAGDMQWLRQLLDWQKETADPAEFLESLRFDLSVSEVFVFTPKGDVIALPQGATPVDFAYAIHTEVGHRCIGARVNDRLVPLESTLDNGDTVEVFTSKSPDAGPSRDWLGFVKSARARNKIKHWFSKERRDTAIESGKEAIARAMRKQNMPLQRMMSGEALLALARDMRYPDVSSLYAAVGESQVSAQHVVQRLVDALGGVESAEEDLAELALPTRGKRARPAGDPGVVVADDPDVWVRLSRCCTPVPGDEIVGFVTRGHGVSVHRTDCANVANLKSQPDRLIDVKWSPGEDSVFLVAIQVEALDRPRLLSDVTRVLSDQHVNILSASVTTTRDRVAVSRFTFEMGDPKHLGHVLKAVRSIDGVYDVYRTTSAAPR